MNINISKVLNKVWQASSYNGPKIVFTHIPKCAGISVYEGIRSSIGRLDQPRVNQIAARKAGQMIIAAASPVSFLAENIKYLQYLLCYHLNLDWKFISGHLPVNGTILDNYNRHHFITMLRKPEDRWCSHYLFNKNDKSRSDGPLRKGFFRNT